MKISSELKSILDKQRQKAWERYNILYPIHTVHQFEDCEYYKDTRYITA